MADLKVSLNLFYEILRRPKFKYRPTAGVFLIAFLTHGCTWCTNFPVKNSQVPDDNFLKKRKIIYFWTIFSIQSFKISRPKGRFSSPFGLTIPNGARMYHWKNPRSHAITPRDLIRLPAFIVLFSFVWFKSHARSNISGKISRFIVHFLLLFHLLGFASAPFHFLLNTCSKSKTSRQKNQFFILSKVAFDSILD